MEGCHAQWWAVSRGLSVSHFPFLPGRCHVLFISVLLTAGVMHSIGLSKLMGENGKNKICLNSLLLLSLWGKVYSLPFIMQFLSFFKLVSI